MTAKNAIKKVVKVTKAAIKAKLVPKTGTYSKFMCGLGCDKVGIGRDKISTTGLHVKTEKTSWFPIECVKMMFRPVLSEKKMVCETINKQQKTKVQWYETLPPGFENGGEEDDNSGEGPGGNGGGTGGNGGGK